MSLYACPKCHRDSCLWRGVEVAGWQSVDSRLEPMGMMTSLEREVYWDQASPDGSYGCGECQWEGVKAQLIPMGIDGKPLPVVHAGQTTITDAMTETHRQEDQ